MSDLSDIELFRIEIDTLWIRDERGRLVKDGGLNGFPAPHVVIACAADGGRQLALGTNVPEGVAAEIERLVAGGAPSNDPSTAPPALARCEELLVAALGRVEVASGPSYVAVSVPELAPGAEIRTDADGAEGLPPPPEEARWTAEEWWLLTAGALGPWAMALVGGEIVAICFSARLTGEAAEAGVWTHPGHRGRGHASAVTAAWVRGVRSSGRIAFYSTSTDNTSSQRVAARLGLRPIGTMWQLRQSRDRVG